MIYCLSCCNTNDEKAKVCSVCSSSLSLCPKDKFKVQVTLNERYKLISPLNKGGMGELYAAIDSRLNCICAVKELTYKSGEDEEREYLLKRFKSEAEILAKLRHPGLPHVIDYFTENDNYYFVMDYIPGYDLETILEREGNPGIEEKKVITWILTICDVLEYLHNHKPQVLYRDLKPSNIMLRARDNQIMLIDFGTARTMEKKVRNQTNIGTVGYAPPEQYMGEQDTRSDIYALGATIYHLVTGYLPAIPFEFQPARKINRSISQKLEQILTKALKKHAKERYQKIEDMKKELLTLIKVEVKTETAEIQEEEKEESWDLLGKIKRNILSSINRLRKEIYPQKKIKVSILSDDDGQSIYKKAIENSGDIEIIEDYTNKEEGLEKIGSNTEKSDIILLDIELTDKTSCDVISKVKSKCSSKLILLSSKNLEKDSILNAFRAGANGYIHKKDNNNDILEAIRKAAKGGAPVEADIVTLLLDELVNKSQVSIESNQEKFDGLELEEVDLFDLLVEFCSCEVTGKVSIKSPLQDGEIYIEDGKIVHCIYGSLTGEEAFYQSVNWITGKLRFYGRELSTKKTINIPTDKLLTEVLTRKELFAKVREKVSLEDRFKMHLTSSVVITLQSDNLYILSHLDNKKTVKDIMSETGKTYFEVSKALYELLTTGLAKKIHQEKS